MGGSQIPWYKKKHTHARLSEPIIDLRDTIGEPLPRPRAAEAFHMGKQVTGGYEPYSPERENLNGPELSKYTQTSGRDRQRKEE